MIIPTHIKVNPVKTTMTLTTTTGQALFQYYKTRAAEIEEKENLINRWKNVKSIHKKKSQIRINMLTSTTEYYTKDLRQYKNILKDIDENVEKRTPKLYYL